MDTRIMMENVGAGPVAETGGTPAGVFRVPTAGSPSFGRADLLLLGVALTWGINVPLVKIALQQFHPLAFNSLRFILAAGLSWIILTIVQPGHRLRRADILPLMLLGLAAHAFYQSMFMMGAQLTTATHSALMLSTSPLHVAWLAALLGMERADVRMGIGLAVSVIGVALVVGTGEGAGWGGGNLAGDLRILIGAVAMAPYTVMGGRFLTRYSPLQYSTYTMVLSTPFLVVYSLPTLIGQDWGVSPSAWGLVAYSGILAIGLAYFLWGLGVQEIGSTRTAIYQNLVPVISVMISVFVLGEKAGIIQLAGGTLIVGGVLLARLRSLRGGPPPKRRGPGASPEAFDDPSR